MQEYINIISRLTEEQKIALLTDFGSLAEIKPTGGIRFKGERIDGTDCKELPTSAVIARSWDTELAEQASEALCKRLGGTDVSCVILPSAKGGIGDINTSLSEEPLLSAAMAAAYLRGAEAASLVAVLEGYSADGAGENVFPRGMHSSVPCDKMPSQRVLYEHLQKPFQTVVGSAECAAIIADGSAQYVGTEQSNHIILRAAADGKECVKAIGRGEPCMKGSAYALQMALHTYKRLNSAIEHGEASTTELEMAVESGEAISPEAIDKALGRLFEFAAMHKSAVSGENAGELKELSAKALRECTVLLRNTNAVLPITAPRKKRKKLKICAVGDIASEGAETVELLLTAAGHEYLGFERGYDMHGDTEGELISQAQSMAEKADIVLLFLGTDNTVERCKLPANQLELCDMLSETAKKTVAVVSSDFCPDLSFDGRFSERYAAVLLAPLGVVGGVENAVKTVLGEISPEGRLTKTFADPTSPMSDRRGMKIGPFVGYRYYDTVGDGAVYPFGHGLTYTEFKYSKPTVSGNTVSLTVTNVGKRDGATVVQFYLGIEDSACLHPKKELVSFERIRLKPKETVTVSAKLLCDAEGVAERCERGEYTVYVGASVSDIRAQCTFSRGSEVLPSDGEELWEYLPTVSNFDKQHFKLEAEYTPMKASLRNLIFGITALLLAVGVKIYDIVTVSGSVFLNIVAVLLGIGAIVCFVTEMKERKKQFEENQRLAEEASRASFEDADDISVPLADNLFAEAYEEDIELEDNSAEAAEEYDYFADVDKTLTAECAAEELSRLAYEKGITLDKKTAVSVLASFATSRLVVLRGMEQSKFEALISLLCEYFGCPYGIDAVNENYVSEADVLFKHSENMYERIPTSALTAISAARSDARSIFIAALTDVVPEQMSAYFAPFAKYARSPHVTNSFTVKNELGSNIPFTLPENVWFVVNIKEGKALDLIPDYISETATVNEWYIELTDKKATELSEFKKFYYGQLIYICDTTRSAFVLDEGVWKKLDALEAYAAQYSDYKIGNKLWLGIEAYLAILTNAGIYQNEAVDETLAVKLIPCIVKALSGKLSRENRGLVETMEFIFGDGNTSACRKVIRESDSNIF